MNRADEAQHLKRLFEVLSLAERLELLQKIQHVAVDVIRTAPGVDAASLGGDDDTLYVVCIGLTSPDTAPRFASAATVCRLVISMREAQETPQSKVASMLIEYAKLEQGMELESFKKRVSKVNSENAQKERGNGKKITIDDVVSRLNASKGTKQEAVFNELAETAGVSVRTVQRRKKKAKEIKQLT